MDGDRRAWREQRSAETAKLQQAQRELYRQALKIGPTSTIINILTILTILTMTMSAWRSSGDGLFSRTPVTPNVEDFISDTVDLLYSGADWKKMRESS